MKFHHHRIDLDLADAVSSAVGREAARSGALIATPTSLRAGIGDVVATTRTTDLDTLPALLFDHTTATEHGRDAIGVTAFTQSPFERGDATTAWVFESTVTVDDHGAYVSSVHDDLETALQGIGDALPLAPASGYVVPLPHLRPTPDGYARLVASAVGTIRAGAADKIVLGRRAFGEVSDAIDPAVVATRLHEREPTCTIYAVPVDGSRYLGASPELLVSVLDDAVTARPLAGTVPLASEDDAPDYGSWLLGSNKNLFEHRVVVEEIVEALSPLCSDVRADETPTVVNLRSVAHLGTWIHAKLDPTSRHAAITYLDALHPTPAVGGRPRDVATREIAHLESEPRGPFAGAVGWMDSQGNGEWWLAIRGMTVTTHAFCAWAGAGIVADSDPIAEREETRAKLDTILVGLGALP